MKRNVLRISIVVIMILLALLISCHSKKRNLEKSPAHHINLGVMYFNQGRVQDAISEMKKAIAMDQKNAVPYQWLGFFCFSMGKYSEAEDAYLQALRIDPYLTEIHNYLGTLCDQTGRKEEALKHYNLVLADKFYPTPEKVHYNLSLMYDRDGNTDEAIHQLRQAVEKNPKYYDAHYLLAKLLEKKGNYQEAVFEYKVAEVSYKLNPDFQFSFALACMKIGDSEAGKQHFRKVIDLAPGTPNAIKARDILDTLK